MTLYSMVIIFSRLVYYFCFRSTGGPQSEYVVASTFMPHPYCNASGGGKIFIVYRYDNTWEHNVNECVYIQDTFQKQWQYPPNFH